MAPRTWILLDIKIQLTVVDVFQICRCRREQDDGLAPQPVGPVSQALHGLVVGLPRVGRLLGDRQVGHCIEFLRVHDTGKYSSLVMYSYRAARWRGFELGIVIFTHNLQLQLAPIH